MLKVQKQSPFINKTQKEVIPEAPQVEELLKNLEFHKSIQRITNRINDTDNLEEIFTDINEDIRQLFNINVLNIYAVDRPKKEIYSMRLEDSILKEIRLPINNSTIAGHAANTKRMIHINDAYNEREIRKIHEQLSFDRNLDKKKGIVTGQVMAIPILHDGSIMGVMEIMNKKGSDKIDDYRQIFLDEIFNALGNTFADNENAPNQNRDDKFDYLIEHGLVTEADMRKAWKKARNQKELIENILMRRYNVYREDIGKALAEYYHCQFISYNGMLPIPHDLLKNIKEKHLQSLLLVPLNKINGKINVIVDDPANIVKREAIEGLLKTKTIKYSVSLTEDILKYIDRFYSSDEVAVDVEVEKEEEEDKKDYIPIVEFRAKMETEKMTIKDESNEVIKQTPDTIEQLVNKIIHEANSRLASDIHIEPNMDTNNIEIRYRIDGVCLLYQTLPYRFLDALISRIKVISNLDPSVKGMPQDGKIRFKKPAGGEIELRVAIIPTQGGVEDVVMSILAKGKVMPLEVIGLSKRHYWELLKLLERYQGMILFAGPTGSGITTTIHACLANINTPEKKIWTAEATVEIKQHGLRQVEIQPQTGLTFAKTMRSFLNADPDVIMVGGMPDFETARICIETSLNGRLILGAMPTQSTTETIVRLMDMGVDSVNFADGLLGILAQRLVRTLCKKCKETYHPSKEEYEELAELYGNEYFETLNLSYSNDLELYRPKGCDDCDQTGYTGRIGIHELLIVSRNIKRMIQRRKNVEFIQQAAMAEGMTTLLQDGIIKAIQGHTDVNQIRRICI
jgi:type II secretory ATPase GspE/PulE/Tfp pilus assembly ATPase PilB-like protein